MGHRRLAGLVSEQVIAGTAMLRIDVPNERSEDGGDAPEWKATQFYGGSAIYALTPCSEKTARATAAAVTVAPVTEWELPALRGLGGPKPDVERELEDWADEEMLEPDEPDEGVIETLACGRVARHEPHLSHIWTVAEGEEPGETYVQCPGFASEALFAVTDRPLVATEATLDVIDSLFGPQVRELPRGETMGLTARCGTDRTVARAYLDDLAARLEKLPADAHLSFTIELHLPAATPASPTGDQAMTWGISISGHEDTDDVANAEESIAASAAEFVQTLRDSGRVVNSAYFSGTTTSRDLTAPAAASTSAAGDAPQLTPSGDAATAEPPASPVSEADVATAPDSTPASTPGTVSPNASPGVAEPPADTRADLPEPEAPATEAPPTY